MNFREVFEKYPELNEYFDSMCGNFAIPVNEWKGGIKKVALAFMDEYPEYEITDVWGDEDNEECVFLSSDFEDEFETKREKKARMRRIENV